MNPATETLKMPADKHLIDINAAKGLTIFLVVFGHIVTGRPPQDNEWFMVIRTVIYSFHMPFFMFLSGYVFYISNSLGKYKNSKSSFLIQRSKRLLIPFIIFGIIALSGKHIFINFMHVDNLGSNFLEDVFHIFLGTPGSSAQFIWYLFSLFTITLITSLISPIISSPRIMMIISAGLFFVPLILIFYIFKTQYVAFFFYLGGIAALSGNKWRNFLKNKLLLFGIMFIFAVIITRYLEIYQLSILICGLSGTVFLHSLCLQEWVSRSSILNFLGDFSFSIYLMNTMFIGLAKGTLNFLHGWDGYWFLLYLPILLGVGIVGPIFVKRAIFRHIPSIDRYTS